MYSALYFSIDHSPLSAHTHSAEVFRLHMPRWAKRIAYAKDGTTKYILVNIRRDDDPLEYPEYFVISVDGIKVLRVYKNPNQTPPPLPAPDAL